MTEVSYGSKEPSCRMITQRNSMRIAQHQSSTSTPNHPTLMKMPASPMPLPTSTIFQINWASHGKRKNIFHLAWKLHSLVSLGTLKTKLSLSQIQRKLNTYKQFSNGNPKRHTTLRRFRSCMVNSFMHVLWYQPGEHTSPIWTN